MLEPRRATGPPPAVAQQRRPSRRRRRSRRPVERAARSRRGRAGRRRGPPARRRRAARAKSWWFSLQESGAVEQQQPAGRRPGGRGTGRRRARRGRPVSAGGWAWTARTAWHDAPPHGRGATALARLSAGQPLNERGRLEIGGCDAIELAREFGTPAYVVAEDDLRARARAFAAGASRARHEDFEVVFASKAFPCTAVLPAVRARRGCGCDVASRRRAAPRAARPASRPSGSCCTATRSPRPSCAWRCDAGVGLIVLDNLDEIERLERLARAGPPRSAVLVRVAPGRRADTHHGDLHRAGRHEVRLRLDDAPRGHRAPARPTSASTCRACTSTSARRSSSSTPFRARARGARRARRLRDLRPRRRARRRLHAARAAAVDRGVRRGQGRAGRTRCCGAGRARPRSSRAARWSPTHA